MIKTDIIIIGAGPVGLFTIFEAGLMKLKCHVIDALPQVGGQLSEIYPKKPIYDIPGFPSVLAGELVDNLMEQAKPFNPGFTLGDRAESIKKQEDGTFCVRSQSGVLHNAPVVIIAGGLGSFEPRKPNIPELEHFENRGVEYMVKDPVKFKGKKLLISGGGDSALDWAIYFAKGYAESVTLVHRSDSFRAHKDSLEQIYKLQEKGKIKLVTHAEVVGLHSDAEHLDKVVPLNSSSSKVLDTIDEGVWLNTVDVKHIKEGDRIEPFDVDYWLPLFGLSPKLGPIGDWGLEIEKNAIKVNNSLDYETNIPGIFAVGDVNTYEGKLKLILCGFHEGTLAVQSAYKIINPDKKFTMKYTTVNGIQELK
ncbi:MAG: NAD(P)/FAD-dependent oxidoreductase [Flavobacteriales bacterium]|nr:NAD(P)/FAD-dependent oxidoreductase [Flavobacteriales bacterium]